MLREERYGIYFSTLMYREDVTDRDVRYQVPDAREKAASMVARNPHSAPRAVGGGRSPRYEKRAHRAGAAKAYASEWSDAAAAAVMSALHKKSAGPRKVSALCDTWLCDSRAHPGFVAQLKLSPADAALTKEILHFHAQKAVAAAGAQELRAVVKSFLKPLRERRAARSAPGVLEIPAATAGPVSFHAWLSKAPGKDRLRPIQKSRRILDGVGKWPLGWLKKLEERSGVLRAGCGPRRARARGEA